MNKNINDQKVLEYRKKKFLRYLYIFLAIVVVALEILALFNILSMVWGLIVFVILFLFKKNMIKWLIFVYFFDIINI